MAPVSITQPDPVKQQALARFGPPYKAVERYLPQALLINEPLPEWRWGQMTPEMITELDNRIRSDVGPYSRKFLEELKPVEEEVQNPWHAGQVGVQRPSDRRRHRRSTTPGSQQDNR